MKKKIKIAFVTPSLTFGGRERVLSLLINYFASKDNAEIYLILYGKKREIFFNLDKKVTIHKPNFDFNELPEALSTIKTLLFLRKSFKKLNINIIVSFKEIWNRFVLLAAFGLKVKKIISNRNNPYRDYGLIDRTLAKILYPQADILIAQTQIAKTVYEKRYKLKDCVVIGNPIVKLEHNYNIQRENIILSVGRLMTSKNHDRLIQIFACIKPKDWKLIIVGGDFAKQNNSEKLKQMIIDLKLEGQVILEGAQKDVNSYLLKSKIFAFTSEKEGFPNVIGEAMAAGLPVVSYDCVAGPSEMIDNGLNGFLIPLFDDQLFAEKLKYLIENEVEREKMGQKALEKIASFDSTFICEKFYKLIHSICDRYE